MKNISKKRYLKISSIILLTAIVVITQLIILKPHLNYGFSDVDWGFLTMYKMQKPFSLSQFIKNIEIGGTLGGVYTHQIYYIGVIYDFFGLNFKFFQMVTHIFKILAILLTFPLFLLISGSSLIAFISVIIFAFSYSAVGTMYTVVTSSDYSAIFSAGIFVVFYLYVVKKKIENWFILFNLLILLIITLFLSTERMYQLPIFIALTEAFLYWQKRNLEKAVIKRILIIFIPLILGFMLKPMVFLSYFLSHIEEIKNGLYLGNWNLLLTPLIALGSIILPHDYTKYLGVVKMDNFISYLEFLIAGPLPAMSIITIIISIFIFQKARLAIFQMFGITFIFSILLYILGSNFTTHQISTQSITQALVGFYVIAVSITAFRYWLRFKEKMIKGLFVGPLFAFLYIVFTWVGASTAEVFSGIHRYLTIPAIFISLFMASLFVLIHINLYKMIGRSKVLKFFSLIVYTPLFFFIYINSQEINAFFVNQLEQGFGAEDKNLMREQLLMQTTRLNREEQSLFYFDFSEDSERGYYYDNTLLGGFSTWMLWHPNINFSEGIKPYAFWNDIERLKAAYKGNDEEIEGLILDKKFYPIENFYAFKLKDKKVINIKKELLGKLENN